MTRERWMAETVLAHFGVPAPVRQQHFERDCGNNGTGGKVLTTAAARCYRTIFLSLSYEERLAAEASR